MAEESVLVETLIWYVRRGAALDGLVHRWLDACRAHLSEAVPARCGDSEPLRERWHTDGGEDGLVAAHARSHLLFALGYDGVPGPTGVRVFGAGLPAGRPAAHLGDTDSLRLHVTAGSFPRVEPFVLAVAGGPGTIAAVPRRPAAVDLDRAGICSAPTPSPRPTSHRSGAGRVCHPDVRPGAGWGGVHEGAAALAARDRSRGRARPRW